MASRAKIASATYAAIWYDKARRPVAALQVRFLPRLDHFRQLGYARPEGRSFGQVRGRIAEFQGSRQDRNSATLGSPLRSLVVRALAARFELRRKRSSFCPPLNEMVLRHQCIARLGYGYGLDIVVRLFGENLIRFRRRRGHGDSRPRVNRCTSQRRPSFLDTQSHRPSRRPRPHGRRVFRLRPSGCRRKPLANFWCSLPSSGRLKAIQELPRRFQAKLGPLIMGQLFLIDHRSLILFLPIVPNPTFLTAPPHLRAKPVFSILCLAMNTGLHRPWRRASTFPIHPPCERSGRQVVSGYGRTMRHFSGGASPARPRCEAARPRSNGTFTREPCSPLHHLDPPANHVHP